MRPRHGYLWPESLAGPISYKECPSCDSVILPTQERGLLEDEIYHYECYLGALDAFRHWETHRTKLRRRLPKPKRSG